MTFKQQHIVEAIFATSLAACIGFFWATYTSNNQTTFTIFAHVPNGKEETITPTLSSKKPRIFSQISPDGTKKVVMTTIENTSATKTYSFSVTDSSGTNGQTVFSKTLDETREMAVPFNAWSPDNRYFFVQEQTNDGHVSDILVANASGKPFADGEIYLDATDIFANRTTGYTFSEATGWASETLIIINTTTPTREKGPSFWFEVPSKAVIQLSTEF